MRLVGERDKVRLSASGPLPGPAALRSVPGVEDATLARGPHRPHRRGGRHRALPAILGAATRAGISIHSVDVEEPNLEAVFLHLTGKALRD